MTAPLVCVALSGHSVEEMLQDAALASAAGSDLVEVRFDNLWSKRYEIEQEAATEEEARSQTPEYGFEPQPFESVDWQDALITLKSGIRLPVIFTCRPTSERGHFNAEESVRLEILRTAIESGVSWVDLEISIESPEREELIESCGEKTKIISSQHLSSTPPASEIITLIEDQQTDDGVVKFCSATLTHGDALRLFDAAWRLRDSDNRYAIMGDGVGGDWPRIHSPILGQFIVYSTMEQGWHLSKSGRMNLEDLQIAWDILEYDY
jgi:3-dehydroquinate dehydratase/shikimate dehydrogenase